MNKNKLTHALLFMALCLCSVQISANNTLVKMQTSEGDIYIELFDDKSPLTVANFLSYVESNYYEGTIFHRVISTFMIQGGGFDETLQRKAIKAPIKNEANNGLKNLRGTIAAARTSDPHSATSQFYINVQDNASLNHTGEQNTNTWGYAVFGKVIKGMDVVDEIRFVATAGKMPFRKDVPIENIVIKSVTVIDALPTSESRESTD